VGLDGGDVPPEHPRLTTVPIAANARNDRALDPEPSPNPSASGRCIAANLRQAWHGSRPDATPPHDSSWASGPEARC
jgi:hypothetical protein